MEKPITIKDIAKKLGLSTSTVSRALSDSWEIKKETKELVIKTAAELNYHPNTQAKGLVTKKSYTIGIVVPELVTSFFPMIISGIQKILMHEGYQILITQSNESAETERTNLSLLEQHMVDGIIISTTSDSFVNSDMYQSLQDNGIPLVFFNRVPSNIDTTKIIIAQRIASVQNADKIIVMNNGCIDAVGTHEQLVDNNKIYSEVYYSQKNGDED